VLAQVLAVGALGTLRVPGLFSQACLRGDCCERFRTDLEADFPRGVGFLSVYSRNDGIVDWRSCLHPAAHQVEINASHVGMSAHPDAYREIAGALARFRSGDARRERRATQAKTRSRGEHLRRVA